MKSRLDLSLKALIVLTLLVASVPGISLFTIPQKGEHGPVNQNAAPGNHKPDSDANWQGPGSSHHISQNRVIVGFRGDETTRARKLAIEKGASVVQEDIALQFAVYQTIDEQAFMQSLKGDSSIRYVEEDVTTRLMASPDFTIMANASSVNLPGSSSKNITLTLASVLGFAGTVTLTATLTPAQTNEPTTSLTPLSVTLTANASGISTLTVRTGNTPNSTYTVTVTGTSGSLIHAVTVGVTVPFPNDPLLSQQWGVPDLNLVPSWLKTVGTKRIIVGVVDTGVWFNHPEISGNLWTAPDGSHGWNCLANTNNATDDFGHGTLVSGVIAASINNGIGVAGTAQAQIMAVKALNSSGLGTAAALACGIRWAADHGANVISISAGGPFSIAEQDAAAYAWSKGALIIAAAGNQACGGFGGDTVQTGCGDVVCPACYNEVIAVSALSQGDGLASFSDFGPKVELTAPGQGILTINWPGNTKLGCPGQLYCSFSGTSLSTPFVSGIAALAWDWGIQHGGTFTNQMIRDALDQNVVHLGTAGRNSQFGYGKPDALALLTNIVASVGPSFSISLSPANMTFGQARASTSTSRVTLASINGFAGAVNLTAVVVDSPPGVCPGPNCPNASLSQTTVSLVSGSSTSLTLTISISSSTPASNYTVAVTGKSGLVSRTVWTYARLPDFSISNHGLVTGVNIAQGASMPWSEFTFLSKYGFNAPLNLTVTVTPNPVNGLAASVGQATLFLPIDLYNITDLTITTLTNTPTGNYIVNVTATGGNVSHSFVQSITVVPPTFFVVGPFSSSYLVPGGSVNITLSLSSQFNFAGTVSLTATVSPFAVNGPTTTFHSANVVLTSNGSNSSILTVSAVSNTPQQTYSINVTGTSGSLSRSLVVMVKVAVPDFVVGGTGIIRIENGVTTQGSQFSVQSVNGFSGTVILSASVSPSSGPTASLYSAQFTLTVDLSLPDTVTISSPDAPATNFTLTITGTSGSLVHQMTAPIIVNDLAFSANPNFLSTTVATNVAVTLQMTALNQYGDYVTLSIVSGLPSCVAASFNPSTLLIIQANPQQSSGTSTLSLTVGAGCTPSSNTIVVFARGQHGGGFTSTSITLAITDFSLSLTSNGPPSSNIWVAKGSNGNTTLTVTSIQGFSDTVTFSMTGLPSGSSFSFIPPSVDAVPYGQVSTTVLISALSSVTPGNYAITLIGTDGSLSHSVSATLKVLASSLSIPSSGQPFNMSGVNVTISGSLMVNTASSDSLTGTLNLNAVNSTSGGALVYTESVNVTLQFGDSNNGMVRVVLDIPSTPLWLSVNCRFDVTTLTYSVPNCFLSRTVDVFHSGSVNLNAVSFVQLRYNTTPSSANWDPRADLDADNLVGFLDATSEQYWYGVTVFLPPFAATSSPASATFAIGNSRSSAVLFQSYGGFSGTITISQISLPSGLSCVSSLSSITLTSGGNSSTTVTCNANGGVAGNYFETVTGTNGSVKSSTIIMFQVTDFSLSTSSTTLSIIKGSNSTSNLTLTSLNGFSGNVTISASVNPIVSKGPTTSLSPPSRLISTGRTGTSVLTIFTNFSTPVGSYVVTVTATSGSTVHTITISVNITSH